MKIDKWELAITVFVAFIIGFETGIIAGNNIAIKSQAKEPLTIKQLFQPNLYTLYDQNGEKVGYQMIDFNGIYYSDDGHNWTDKPIRWIRKEKIK